MYFLAVLLGIFNLRPGTGSDVAANIDHVDGVGHVYLALVHVVQHLLCAFSPHLIISGMPEEADADYDIALQGEPLLRLKELILKARAAAEGYDWIFSYHITSKYICNAGN
jgi:hypothetical protein